MAVAAWMRWSSRTRLAVCVGVRVCAPSHETWLERGLVAVGRSGGWWLRGVVRFRWRLPPTSLQLASGEAPVEGPPWTLFPGPDGG